MKMPKRPRAKPKLQQREWSTAPLDGNSGRGPFPPDNSDLQRRIKENPLGVAAEARYKLDEVRAGYRRELYEVLAMIVGIARHYYFNYKAWKPFFNQPFFQTGKLKPKPRTQHTAALRHTMNYVFDAKSKQARSRTGKYAAALHEIMITGVPVHLVAAEIEKAGGIEKLYEAYLEREAHKPKKGAKQIMSEEDHAFAERYYNLDSNKRSEPQDMTLGDLDDGQAPAEGTLDDEQWDFHRAGADGGLDIFDEADFQLTPTMKRGRDPAGRRTIELEVTKDRQSKFFDMVDGQEAVIHVTCLGTDREWQRIRVRKVNWTRR